MIGGYQVYVVEQWISDRHRFYNTVVAYTGDPKDLVKTCIIDILDEKMPMMEKLFESFESERSKPMEVS